MPDTPSSGLRLLKWPIRGRKSTAVLYFAAVLGACILSNFLAYALRFEFHIPDNWGASGRHMLRWIIPLQLVCLYATGALRPLTARLRSADVIRTCLGIGLFTLFLLFIWYHFDGEKSPPRSVIILQATLVTPMICFLQACTPYLYHTLRGDFSAAVTAVAATNSRALVIGTGYVAAQLIQQLLQQKGRHRVPVGVVTLPEQPPVQEHFFSGVPVVGPLSQLESLVHQHDADTLLIAVPTLSPELIQRIVNVGNTLRLSVRIVPSPQEMPFGQVKASELRPVSLGDALGRNVLDSDIPAIHSLVSGKRVLVTGAAGSIGSELCRQILAYEPEALYVLDSSEPQLYTLEQTLAGLAGVGRSTVHPLLYNVRSSEQIGQILASIRPHLVFHSAALKHVPMLERFPAEALRTNTLATADLALAAARAGAERFVFVSTDKAINPTNAMGASKRLAEMLLRQVQQQIGQHAMQIISVRFGNVLNSSGSVVPLFEKQIRTGGPVTVTDPAVTRYFMSIPEAVGLVLQSATMGKAGDIFVLDMGEPMKVLDMAHKLIALHGLRPEQDIEIKIVGLRPGEKLFEELSYDSENHLNTSHPRIWRLREAAAEPVAGKPVPPASEPPSSATPAATGSALPETAQATSGVGGDLYAKVQALAEASGVRPPAEVRAGIAALLPEYLPDNR